MATHREELEIESIRAGIEKTRTEINKMIAETTKINSENKYYPLIIGSTATLAIVAVVKLFL